MMPAGAPATRHLAWLLLLSLPLGCDGGGGAMPGRVRLLLDGDHLPELLVEESALAHPPSPGGNRFLTGWWPEKEGRRLLLIPEPPRARLQIAHLDPRPRTLLLDLAAPPATPGRVRVRAAGRDLGAFPVADPTEIRLPGDLPVGAVDVDLAFEPEVKVLAAAVRPALPAGNMEIQGADLVQSGDSLIRIVRRVSPGAELVGTFVPPAHPASSQRFELTVEREDGSTVRRFSWAPGFWSRRRTIALPLDRTAGWVRICLRAKGKGPGARWVALGFRGGETVSTARTEPVPPFPKPRLVIVYVLDALRADFLGHLGGPAGVSPTIDRLAREGITFREHRSVAPNTLPSTKALLTGHAFASRGGWKLAPGDGPTLAELFKAAGYHTGLFSGSVYVSPAYGTDRGFEHVAEGVQIDDEESPAGRQAPFNDNAARVHAAALRWLATLPPAEPAFLYVHVIHPHNPYDPPEPFRSRFTAGIPSAIDGGTKTLIGIKQRRLSTTPADRRRLRGLYAGSLAYADAEMAGFLEQVAARTPPGETLVAVTADHGEEHFEHGGILHGFTLFQEQLRIPLVLWAPGRLPPAEVRERTDTLDLHATLAALAGLRGADGRPAPSSGRPLLQVIRGETGDYVHLAAAASVKGGIYAALHGRWKLIWAPRTGIHWGQGDALGRAHDPELLFDLEKDPGEQVNLAGEGDLEAAWLRERLLAWIEKNRQEDKGSDDQPQDKKTLEQLKALGYVN
jgi:arylsulfatase A-like enzyme